MYDYDELKSVIEIDEMSVECPVRGCARRVARQRKRFRVEERFRCPEHRIVISPSTFEYERDEENIICADREALGLLAAIRLVKRESRMRRERSEDAVTWNVFRSLEKADALGSFANLLPLGAGVGHPRAIYWSYCPDTSGPWPPLIEAATGFGERPGRHTEPDLILLFEDLLVFVEAKLGSGNVTRPSDPTNPKSYETGYGGWFRQVFCEGADFRTVAEEARLYELMRLWLIGSRIAQDAGMRFALVNLVRSGDHNEGDIERRFGRFISQTERRCFARLTWERIVGQAARDAGHTPEIERLGRYLRGKSLGYARPADEDRGTATLRRAFEMTGTPTAST